MCSHSGETTLSGLDGSSVGYCSSFALVNTLIGDRCEAERAVLWWAWSRRAGRLDLTELTISRVIRTSVR